jgi:outer membrane protein assembly factor BamB
MRLTRDRQGGTAYVGAANGHVLAINLSSGASGLAADLRAPVEGAPVLAGGRICALGADGVVHAIPLGVGRPAVIYELPAGGTGTPAVTSDGKLLVSDTSGQVHAIDAATGARAWVALTGGLVLAAPVQAGPWLYLCGTDGVVHEVSAADGTERATSKLTAPIHVAPTVAGNRLYVGTADGTVHAFDTARPGNEPLVPFWEPLPLREEIGGLAADGGRVYVAVGRRLVEIDAAWGRWAHDLHFMDRLIGASPVLAGRHCYVTDLGGLVECLVVGEGARPA